MAFDLNSLLRSYGNMEQPQAMTTTPGMGMKQPQPQQPQQQGGGGIGGFFRGLGQNVQQNPGLYMQMGTALMNRGQAGDGLMQGIGNAMGTVAQQLQQAEQLAYQKKLEERDYDWQQKTYEQQRQDRLDQQDWQRQQAEWQKGQTEAANTLLNQMREWQVKEAERQAEEADRLEGLRDQWTGLIGNMNNPTDGQGRPMVPFRAPPTQQDLQSLYFQMDPGAMMNFWGQPSAEGYQTNPLGGYRAGGGLSPADMLMMQMLYGGGITDDDARNQ